MGPVDLVPQIGPTANDGKGLGLFNRAGNGFHFLFVVEIERVGYRKSALNLRTTS